MQKGFEDWSSQISTHKFSFNDNKDSSIPEWMGLNKGALEIWDTVANSIGLGGVPDIPGLDKGKVEISRLLKSPALGQWREHQQQLQNIAQLLIEFQEADQVYKLAFAQMGIRSIDALRQRLSNIGSDEEKVSTVREFYDLWVDVNEEIYSEFTMTDEYQVIHGDFVNALMALRKETNALTEKMYKALNLPTRSELNTINKRLQEQRRENIQLRNEIKKLASQIASKSEKKTEPTSKSQTTLRQDKDLAKIKGVGPKIVEKLHTQGIETLEQIANATNATFIRLIGSELVQKYIGEGARLVRELFQLAQEKAPSIIFIDELDAVGAKRMDVGTTGDREVQRTLMQLLGELDGFTPRGDVAIMGASNRPDILDEALLRPGRFDRIIKIPLPEEKARLKIIKIHTAKMAIAKGVNYKKMAAETDGLSGADLRAVCVEAGMGAIKNKRIKVSYKDFTLALEKIKNRLNETDISEPEGGLYY